jgi:hypothetical protein
MGKGQTASYSWERLRRTHPGGNAFFRARMSESAQVGKQLKLAALLAKEGASAADTLPLTIRDFVFR